MHIPEYLNPVEWGKAVFGIGREKERLEQHIEDLKSAAAGDPNIYQKGKVVLERLKLAANDIERGDALHMPDTLKTSLARRAAERELRAIQAQKSDK